MELYLWFNPNPWSLVWLRTFLSTAKIQRHAQNTNTQLAGHPAPCKVSLSGLYSTESIKIQHHAVMPIPQLLDLAGIGTPSPMQSIPVWAIQYRVHQNTTPCNNTTTQLLDLAGIGKIQHSKSNKPCCWSLNGSGVVRVNMLVSYFQQIIFWGYLTGFLKHHGIIEYFLSWENLAQSLNLTCKISTGEQRFSLSLSYLLDQAKPKHILLGSGWISVLRMVHQCMV